MSAFAPLVGGKRTSITAICRTVVDLTLLVFHNMILQIAMALALTNEQLAAVHAAADAVPPNWRSRFFSAVADLLTLTPDPSNRPGHRGCEHRT
jgi:hypothetical protein